MDFDMNFDFDMNDSEMPLPDDNDLTIIPDNSDLLNPTPLSDSNLITPSDNSDWLNSNRFGCSQQPSSVNGSTNENIDNNENPETQWEPINPMHWEPGSDIKTFPDEDIHRVWKPRGYRDSLTRIDSDVYFGSENSADLDNSDDNSDSSVFGEQKNEESGEEGKVNFGATSYLHHCHRCNHKWWDHSRINVRCPKCDSYDNDYIDWD